MLRPRTRQAVGIIDELLGQFNRDNTYQPPMRAPKITDIPFDQGSTGSSAKTFGNALSQFNIDQTPTPLMPATMRSQREPFRPQVNRGDTSSNMGVPADAPVGSVNVPQVTPRAGDFDMSGFGMLRPGADVMGMEKAAADADALTRQMIANPELKSDPGFMDQVTGYFKNPENMLRLALAFNSMRESPDQALASVINSELKDLRAMSVSNKTAKAVAAQLRSMGFNDEAALVEANPSMAKEIYSSIITSRKPQSAIAKLNADLKAGRITQAEYDIGVEALKKAGINIDLNKKGDQAYLTTAMGSIADTDIKAADAALAAVTSINKIDQTLSLLASGAPTTGMGAEFKQFVDRGLALLGDRAAIERAADTQLLESLLGTDVFGAISALGIGARGLDTPAEREFLRSVLTGTTNMTAEAIEQVSNLRRKYAQKAIDFYNQKVERGDYDALNAQLGTERYKKIEIPEAPQRAKYKIGDTWTDQNTNVTYRFKGPVGQWMNRDNWEEVQ
jgi:hypothetical protein